MDSPGYLAWPTRAGRSNWSKSGGRLPRLQSIENSALQPVLWAPPTAPAPAPNDATERRPSTTKGQRISARPVRSRTASTLAVGRLWPRREPGSETV